MALKEPSGNRSTNEKSPCQGSSHRLLMQSEGVKQKWGFILYSDIAVSGTNRSEIEPRLGRQELDPWEHRRPDA